MEESFYLTSFLHGENAAYIEALENLYKSDPASVHPEWQAFFAAKPENVDAVLHILSNSTVISHRESIPVEKSNFVLAPCGGAGKIHSFSKDDDAALSLHKNLQAIEMINAYRSRGHFYAKLDPLGCQKQQKSSKLLPSNFGFSDKDCSLPIYTDNALPGHEKVTLSEMVEKLHSAYCSTIGVEFMHISDPQEREWIRLQFEEQENNPPLSSFEKKKILQKLIEAEGFERFIDLKRKGAKRFGLDGAESLIPFLETALEIAASMGLKEAVIGMAHRGRLNVLTQITGKPHYAVFHEFIGGAAIPEGFMASGDVKYHLGASVDREFSGRKVHLSLLPNPSHLEIVDPVVMGQARARQDRLAFSEKAIPSPKDVHASVLPFLIHGDAAFAGQGVVYEIFGLSELPLHSVGGGVHFIINNQIGFTTNPGFSRSFYYPSEVAKVVGSPIFHVNGDDPEAIVRVAKLAVAFRMKFHKPVVIDMFCYRRFGHNEGDEPSFTQPLMYKQIRDHRTVVDLYSEKLIEEGVVSPNEVSSMQANWRKHLEESWEKGQTWKPEKADWLQGLWTGLSSPELHDGTRPIVTVSTGVSLPVLKEIGMRLSEIPDDFEIHKTIARLLENRRRMIETGEGFDWAMAEALAFGSLLLENVHVRLSGQDCERGTFSQRHSVLYDQRDETSYVPLNNISSDQARYEVINSMLSEEAVLGFEYGYSTADPMSLVLWEAQFGDFANGAQVIFDQFVVSAESKWLRMSGLVCLLPHGYEGQGPEHSSARLERFLQLCAEDNIQVAYCTTPANYFHVLRRQLKQNFRRPLILMTPKSLLRHKQATSSLVDFAENSVFSCILRDDAELSSSKFLVEDSSIRRVVLCSGKVYYDLYEEREKRGMKDVYLLRVEQLYPFPAVEIATQLSRFINSEIIWCQEEPANMGAWSFVRPRLEALLEREKASCSRVAYAGRPASASPAVGLTSRHFEQLQAFLDDALGKITKQDN